VRHCGAEQQLVYKHPAKAQKDKEKLAIKKKKKKTD
jgi:hypothetical protein